MNRLVGLVEAKRKAHQPSDWLLHHPIGLKDAAASFGIVKVVVPRWVDDRDWNSKLRQEISTIIKAKPIVRGPIVEVRGLA